MLRKSNDNNKNYDDNDNNMRTRARGGSHSNGRGFRSKASFFFQPHFTDNKYVPKTTILKIVFLSASTQYKKCYLFFRPKMVKSHDQK